MKITESARRIELARKCLALISRIAARGACSEDPANIGYALQELTQVMFERTGSEEVLFEPVPANQIRDLEKVLDELGFVDSGLPAVLGEHFVKFAPRGAWN